MPTSAEIRARARQSLQGIWGRTIGYLLLFYLVIGVPLGLIDLISYVGEIITILVSGAITLGVTAYFMDIARGSEPPFSTLFSGFNSFFRALLLYVLQIIFVSLWMLLLIVPGIIASYRYAMSYYIMRDNPDITALEAIRRSKAMMVGHKWRLFVLGLTFIGWCLLGIITLGIGFLWIYPYMATSIAHFYDDLKDHSQVTSSSFLADPGPSL